MHTFPKSKTPEELRHWAFTKEQIGQKLKNHYQAYMTEELPPRLLAALKKLDEELPQVHSSSKSDSK
jgi:hypothetical protein